MREGGPGRLPADDPPYPKATNYRVEQARCLSARFRLARKATVHAEIVNLLARRGL